MATIFGPNKQKLRLFQFCTRFRELFRMKNRVIGVGELKYAILIFKGGKELPLQPSLGQNKQNKIAVILLLYNISRNFTV